MSSSPTPLDYFLDAARRGELESVKEQLEKDSTLLNQQGEQQFTALQAASHGGHANVVEYLLSKDAAVNTQNSSGDTALHLAVWKDQVEIVKLLLKYGAEQSIKNRDGKTAKEVIERDMHPRRPIVNHRCRICNDYAFPCLLLVVLIVQLCRSEPVRLLLEDSSDEIVQDLDINDDSSSSSSDEESD